MISHTGFCIQNVTHGTLVFLIFLNLTKTTLRKAEELGEALGGGIVGIKLVVSAKALYFDKEREERKEKEEAGEVSIKLAISAKALHLMKSRKKKRSSASTGCSLLTCLLGCRLPLTLPHVL